MKSNIPFTTASNSRYQMVPASNGSRHNHHSNQSFNKSSLMSNQSFTSYPNNNSILYPNKAKKVLAKNSWSHPFSIPIEVGNPTAASENPELQLWSNVHVVRLRTNNRKIHCGGLQWDIYIHPNQGENGQEYALSVFPVKNNLNDKLPPNYKLQYKVRASLNVNKIGDRNDDDQKCINKFDHEWTREVNEIIYDANPGDIAGSSNSQIEWRSHMERLSFNKRDLYQCGLDDDYFSLYISIHTTFIRQPAKRSAYYGVLGAILLQSEQEVDQQRKQIEKLNNKKDELVMTLQNQLNTANRLNTQLAASHTKSEETHQKYEKQIGSFGEQIQNLIHRDEQRSKQNERKIANLTSDLQMKDNEIARLRMSLHQYKTELVTQNQIAGINKVFQQQLPTQQISEQQRLLAQQRYIQQQQQIQASNQVTNPFQSNNDNNQSMQPQVINNSLPPQTQSSGYSSFPGNSPQKNVTNTRSTLIIDNSPQTTVSNQSQQSPQQIYKAKIVQQPDLTSFQQPSPQIVDNNNGSFNDTQQQFAPQSPQQISVNDNSFMMNNDNNNTNNIPPLEVQPEAKQQKEEEHKSQADNINLNESTPASNTGKTQSQSPIKNLSQNDNKQNVDNESPELQGPDENIGEDDEGEFQHRPARAWRWDKDQSKWRGRGKGQLSIFYNKVKGLAKIVFVDEKHDKTRLLQWIDGQHHAKFTEEETNSNNNPIKENHENVEWFGSDYTMDPVHPMEGSWKLAFMDNPTAAQQFVDIFNNHIDAYNGNNVPNANNVHQEVSTTAPIDEEEDNKSNDSTKPFENKPSDNESFGSKPFESKPFSFDMKNEKPKESFTDNPTDFGNSTTLWSFDTNNSGTGNANETSSSFGNIDWGFKPSLAGQPSDEKVENKPADNNDNADNSNNNNNKAVGDEDNGIEYTFQAIAPNLTEQNIDSGHENEELIKELKFIKLYRFGKDVAGVPTWKNRASSSNICFYKSSQTGKIRMIAREQETSKLRMNQNVPVPSSSNFSSKSAKIWQWMAYDSSIAQEEEDESAGTSQWCIKFDSKEKADEFKQIFEESSNSNASITSPTKPPKPVQDEPATPQQTTTQQQVTTQQQATEQNDALTDKVEDKIESKPQEEDEFKGMTKEEIAAQQAREEKRKEAEKASKLFSGGDDGNNTVSWSGNIFDKSIIGNNDNQFTFSEDQRGVDLVAEKEMNKIATDPSISFGVNNNDQTGQEQDFSNVTTRDANNNNDNQENPTESTTIWNSNFSFSDDKPDNNQQEKNDGFDISGGFSGAGGFSGVKVTDGFANVSWANNDNDGGFGSFGDANNSFNFEELNKSAQEVEVGENKVNEGDKKSGENDNDKNNNDNNNDNKDDEDNGGEITFKPLVDLEEVEVESGHENEKMLKSFEVVKVYRWGKDVSGVPGWKSRASKTQIKFYQSLETGRIRIVCRENITNKLRLNQLINNKLAKLEKKSEKQVGWNANDATIAAEEEDETKGFCPFAAKFINAETCEQFLEFFKSAADNNDQLPS